MSAINGLEYFAEDHSYFHDGRSVPSVTQVMQRPFPINAPPDRLEVARQLGVAIHTATALYDRNQLDWSTVDPRIAGHIEAWVRFSAQCIARIVAIERRVYHELAGYAGTLDRVFVDANGDVSVIDIKKPELGPLVGVQTAGYQDAWNTEYKHARAFQIKRRYGVTLRADGTYRMREYTSQTDFSIFLACLNIHKWRVINGI